jgi:hypothetical protein
LDSKPIETPNASKVIPLQNYRFARDPADYKSTNNDYRSETFEEKLERLHPISKYGNAMMGEGHGLLADQIIEEEKQLHRQESDQI